MILFTILLIMVAVITVILLSGIIAVGGSFIAVFGDFIVFGLIVWLIVKIFKSKNNKES